MKGISKELQIGKAGEHLVCCDLIKKGYNAFLSDQGLYYDIVLDKGKKLYRIQVKTTSKKRRLKRTGKDFYSFIIRSGKKPRVIKARSLDYLAFAFLDLMIVAYVPVSFITTKSGNLKQSIHFYEKQRTKHSGSGGNRKYIIGNFSEL